MMPFVSTVDAANGDADDDSNGFSNAAAFDDEDGLSENSN